MWSGSTSEFLCQLPESLIIFQVPIACSVIDSFLDSSADDLSAFEPSAQLIQPILNVLDVSTCGDLVCQRFEIFGALLLAENDAELALL